MFPSIILSASTLMALFEPVLAPDADAAAKPEPVAYEVTVTAYSSTPDQTDSTPFITASNKTVRWGFVAANFLEFGTKVQIPELYGDQVFVVEDRMHRRFSDRVDIWMPTKAKAKRFGIKRAEIIVLAEADVQNLAASAAASAAKSK